MVGLGDVNGRVRWCGW